MSIVLIAPEHLQAIEAHGMATYPNEGAGFMLGRVDGDTWLIAALLPIDNRRELEAQHNRFELSPRDFMQAEAEADRRGLDLIGVFHSHPDHPAEPSAFDRDHALPNFSYLITSVQKGQAQVTRAWRLNPDRSAFDEDTLEMTEHTGEA